jgi:hypothetical protein
MRKLKYNIGFFKNLAIERGSECLSNEFVGVNKKIKIKCEKGHVWDVVPYSLLKNTWCPYCSNRNLNGHFKRLTIEEMQEIAKERGGECLSDKYISNNIKLKWKCKLGHIWECIPMNIKNNNYWCPKCSKKKKLTIIEMQEIAKERNGKCLSEKYVNKETKLLWECKYGHRWMSTPGNIKNGKNWCPHCVETIGERIVNEYLSKNNIVFIKEKKFSDCRSKYPLSFDFYLTDFNILIEYDGIQHFKPTRFKNCSNEYADEQYCELIKRDAIKNRYCIDNDIRLIRIPHTIKNIEEHLNETLFNGLLK